MNAGCCRAGRVVLGFRLACFEDLGLHCICLATVCLIVTLSTIWLVVVLSVVRFMFVLFCVWLVVVLFVTVLCTRPGEVVLLSLYMSEDEDGCWIVFLLFRLSKCCLCL